MWLLGYRILRCTTHETQLTAGAIENTLIWEVAYCFGRGLLVRNVDFIAGTGGGGSRGRGEVGVEGADFFLCIFTIGYIFKS